MKEAAEAAHAIALNPKRFRWLSGRRSGGKRTARFATKHIHPLHPRFQSAVPIHYLQAFRAIGVRNCR